ncbi:MAG: hypothetical protein V4507_13070 [Verrucomicrobiota bacterium]
MSPIREDGTIHAPEYHASGIHAGPALIYEEAGEVHPLTLRSMDRHHKLFSGSHHRIQFEMEWNYSESEWKLTVRARNKGTLPWHPDRLALRIGLDCRMQPYPEWTDKHYPTFLRCEKTHFWGYASTPHGKGLLLASPDAIASWSLDYAMRRWDDGTVWGAQIVNTFDLDLLRKGALPERHPQHLSQLAPGEEKRWQIFGRNLPIMENLEIQAAALCKAPVIQLPETTVDLGQKTAVFIHSSQKLVEVLHQSPSGEEKRLTPEFFETNLWRVEVEGTEAGLHRILVQDISRKQSEGSIFVVKQWSEILKKAGDFALKNPPQSIAHCEGWYGFFSGFLKEKYFPQAEYGQKLGEHWGDLLKTQFDEAFIPAKENWRVQNKSTLLSLFVDRYQAYGDLKDLESAAQMADLMIATHQGSDGAFWAKDIFYSTVIYPIKSLIELWECEEKIKTASWIERTERHRKGIEKAILDLEKRGDDLQTEGEQFFEDGMISCAALQLAAFALAFPKSPFRDQCLQRAQQLLAQHDCLSQTVTPDARVRGGTHRTWEAQYDIHLQPAAIVCPHGWSSWRTYATYYLYLLTGEISYLLQTRNALAAAAQMIDEKKDLLYWGFLLDPHLEARQVIPFDVKEKPDLGQSGFAHPDRFPSRSFVVSEQYMEMVSHWSSYGSNDNDVHEHFKCLEEVIVGKAYLHEREDGSFFCWNCDMESSPENVLKIKSSDALTKSIHLHLLHPQKVQIFSQSESQTLAQGNHWISIR